jgi:hypothetical protein
MTNRTDFTAEEWQLLLESVMMAGIAVTAADPSGLWGTLKEGMATASSLRAAKSGPNALVAAVAAEFETAEGRDLVRDGLKRRLTSNKPAEIKAQSIEGLRQAAILLDGKAAQDSAAFKEWLQEIARKAAEASNEGGFLGFGGVPVSAGERAALVEIASALGTELLA